MIRNLTLENYRSFESYQIRNLAQVNLLVGPNNCGKTSVLEAAQLLAARGDPSILIASCRRRGEVAADAEEEPRRVVRYPLYHHFRGHAFSPGHQPGNLVG